MNRRIAHGRPRIVDPEREVVLVTGGASGLGLLIAQMYGMKGGSVAVLDIKDMAQEECEEAFGVGVRYYRGDVGDRAVLQSVKEQVETEVCSLFLWMRKGGFEIDVNLIPFGATANVRDSWGLRLLSSIVQQPEFMASH